MSRTRTAAGQGERITTLRAIASTHVRDLLLVMTVGMATTTSGLKVRIAAATSNVCVLFLALVAVSNL